jgi:hypothetical protein
VAGGFSNVASGDESTIAGGVSNDATGYAASVGGGLFNQANASFATIAGGGPTTVTLSTTANRVTDNYGAIGGGADNQAGDGDADLTDATYATVAGGEGNTASGRRATVGGGNDNTASGYSSTVGGGQNNTATDHSATVGGGEHNDATAYRATVGGGGYNYASGQDATIAGGSYNKASGDDATVGGGDNNDAYGDYGTVPGGFWNSAGGDYSFAAGTRARAIHTGAFVWADSNNKDFRSTTSDSFEVRSTGGVTFVLAINATTGNPTWACHVSNGSTSWSCGSDRSLKQGLLEADGGAVLEALAQMPIYYWSAKGADTRHIGPMAQDFAASFAVGEDDVSIATIDLDGVALAAIQGLHQLNQDQAANIAALEAENAALRAQQASQQEQLADLAGRLARLEAGGGASKTAMRIPAGWLLLGGLGAVAGVVLQRRRSGGAQ